MQEDVEVACSAVNKVHKQVWTYYSYSTMHCPIHNNPYSYT